MVPDLTLEVIYLNQPTDFKMEFELCVGSNVRFLSLPVKSHGEFLTAISKSVVRSRAIITVGSFNPLDKLYMPKIIAKATGYELQAVENEKFGISSEKSIFLPKNSLPLLDAEGNLGGCVLENNDQAIIMLTSDKELRHNIVKNLVCPYLKLFAGKKTNEFNNVVSTNASTVKNENQIISDNNQERIEIPAPSSDEVVTENQSEDIASSSLQNDEMISEIQPTSQKETDNITINEESIQPEYEVLEQPVFNTNPEFDLGGLLIDESDSAPNDKPKKSKPIAKIIISVILVLAVLLASYFGYDRLFQPMQRTSVYEDIRALYGQTWSELPEDMFYKFGKLYQTNSDIFGWISIPNTSINLPVVSSAKKSSSYYRNHLFEGSVNRYGTLYTPSESAKGMYHRNIVIYGKNTGDNVMFSELDKFLRIEQYKEVPSFTFDTLYFENKWKIFSVFKIDSKNEKSYLKTDFFDDTEFSKYVGLLEKISVIDTNIDVTYSDEIITLVSQNGKTDVILVARRVRDGESPLVDVTGTSENYYAENSSDIPVIAEPLQPIDSSSSESVESETVDENMTDGASSRYEQQETTSSIIIEVKPILPTISSVPEFSSRPSSNVTTSNTDKVSSAGKVSSETSTSSVVTSSGTAEEHNLPMLTVTNTFNGEKVRDTAINIVASNIEAEMGKSYHIEALKAQAVAAFSWLLNNGSAEDKYPSLPLKSPSQKCIEATKAVAGQVAVYNGRVATTYYYAISAGKTAYSQDIWSNAVPYLVSVDSSVDKSVNGYQTTRKYSSSQVAQIAKDILDIDLTLIEDKTKWFECSYDVNGVYCTKIKIGGVEKKGTYMRDTFFKASRVGSANVLRSSAYRISYNKDEDKFIFTVRGYGHGVGMSQAGANVYANDGWSYEKILKHYYTGISIGTYYIN